ncbi:MAG: ankyrin repeat domain-containing protein [Candidatus Eutrophobiaceae bacterium]
MRIPVKMKFKHTYILLPIFMFLSISCSCGEICDSQDMWELPSKRWMSEHCDAWGMDEGVCQSEWEAAMWLENNRNRVSDSVKQACNALADKALPSYGSLRQCAGSQPSEILLILVQKVEDEDLVEGLLDEGARLDARDSKMGGTALHWAAKYHRNEDVVELLLERGANPNVKDTKYGDAPLHWAAKDNENPKVIDALIEQGAVVNSRANNKMTPLILAVWFNPNREVIKALLDAGANVHIGDELDREPLHYAESMREREKGRMSIVHMLKESQNKSE